ncbi:MAG: hypothetical protein WD011_07755 [Nitriliruptoraceae bacterium]
MNAVTLARVFTDSATGIAPVDVAAFVAAQLAGTGLAIVLVLALFPTAPDRKAAQ